MSTLPSEEPEYLRVLLCRRLLMMLQESGHGEVLIRMERVRVDRVSMTILCGVSNRFVFSDKSLFEWLEKGM